MVNLVLYGSGMADSICSKTGRCEPLKGVSGKRGRPAGMPSSASACFTGIGLTSQKSASTSPISAVWIRPAAFTGSSVAFHIGGKAIYWYGIIIALGVLLALWFCMKQKEKYGITEDNLMDGVLWGVPLAIVGARLYYVLFYLDRFKKADGSFDWAESIAIWDGGLAIYGGVIAAVLVCFVLSKKRGFKLGALTDLIVMGFLIGQAVGRWGNFMNREAFGAETTLPWRMQLTTTAGTLVEVHPTFLYESLWNVVGLLLIVFIVAKGRRFDGENTWFYFLWYGIGRA